MTHVLSLDIGTSSVRARLYDATGAWVGDVEARTPYGPAEAEVDPDELVDAVRAALDEATAEAAGRADAVAASCFWHSLLAVDADGRPLTPVQTWRDLRAREEAAELASLLGAGAVHARTGCPLHPSFWPAKLLRLRRAEPRVFEAARAFLSFPDYLYRRLGKRVGSSLSMASGTGLLGLDGRWDAELLDALGLDEERLPPVSDEPDGGWFPALGDGACANVGTGCVEPGRAALSLGTSGALRVVRGAGPPRPGLFLYRLDSERLVEGGSISDGGNLFGWLRDTLRLEGAEGIADEPADGHGLTFLALLGGERSPGWRADARGAIAGLSFDTTPRHVLQAGLEGVALRLAEIADLLRPEQVVATGGAANENHDWVRIVADALGLPVALSAVEESSCRGAAVVALERLGESPAPAPLGPTFEPRPERTEAYRAARERQRALYAAVTSL